MWRMRLSPHISITHIDICRSGYTTYLPDNFNIKKYPGNGKTLEN